MLSILCRTVLTVICTICAIHAKADLYTVEVWFNPSILKKLLQ